MHLNRVLLFFDIITWVGWIGFYIFLLTTTKLDVYIVTHLYMFGHILATLRLVAVTEQQYMNENAKYVIKRGFENKWWNIATFVFAVVSDTTNLLYVAIKVSSSVNLAIYIVELVFSILFLFISIMILIWFISAIEKK